MSGYTVERSDLRGWAAQVGRGSDDMKSAHGYATGQVTDGDFGFILDLITGPYDDLIGKFHGVLEADATGLDKTSKALTAAEQVYRSTDSQASDEFSKLDKGSKGKVQEDGQAKGFDDRSEPTDKLQPPTGDITLPEVEFGFPWDQICGLCDSIAGFDPREMVTKWLTGDLGKPLRQSIAWNNTAECTDGVQGNLKSGQEAISHTWTGEGSNAAAKHVGLWLESLTEQADGMRKIEEYLKTSVDEAVKMAQVVVDIVKTVISLLTAALSNAAIPFYGQWKLVKSVWDGVKMFWSAVKVINVFKQAITMVIDGIKMVAGYFDVTALPPAPAAVPR